MNGNDTEVTNDEPINEDRPLIEACVRGDRISIRCLYDRYKDRLYATCIRMLGSVDDAEDALQDTFVRTFRYLPGFKYESSLSTWLYRIAINVCIEMLRKRSRAGETVSIEDHEHECMTPPPGGPDNCKTIIDREIQNLPEGYKAVFVLHAVEGFKHHEIARMLDISTGTSKSQYYQARERLRKKLKPYLEVLRYEMQ